MRFRQLDRIVDLRPGVEITAERTLQNHDAFLLDHFPDYPVLPGVLTLEAMFQACDWLVRKTDGFSRTVVLLKEARNVKFSGLVCPGQSLTVTAHARMLDDRVGKFVARATVDDEVVATGRLVVERFNLADRYPARAASDEYLRQRKQQQYEVLNPDTLRHEPVAPTGFRWMWIDRFTEFISGRRAKAIKTVSLTDEPLDLYMPGFPVMPCSLIIEGLAQTGGILVSEDKDFQEQVVLAKTSKAIFHRPALPGDTMTFFTEIVDVEPEGAMVRGTSHIGDELHAEMELFFAYLDDRLGDIELIGPADVLSIVRLYGLYDVGETGDGTPLEVPQRMLDAERRQLSGSESVAE